MPAVIQRNSFLVKFMFKVNKDGPIHPAVGQCWVWTGAKCNKYGWLGSEYAHRLSYTMNIGPISKGLLVCHRCDNPICVNPRHLFLGTSSDNLQDMVAKGRHGPVTKPERLARGDQHGRRTKPECNARGEGHGMAKLTENNVHEIRTLYERGEVSVPRLAEMFGVCSLSIRFIVNRKTWKHVV